MIRRLAAAAAVCAALATGSAALATAPVSASPTGPAISATAQLHAAPAAARRCSTTGQNVRVTHNSTTTVLRVITPRCGRKYQAWERNRTGTLKLGAWVGSGTSTAYNPNGGNFDGGWRRRAPSGLITAHTSY